jgi:hypothetical protein
MRRRTLLRAVAAVGAVWPLAGRIGWSSPRVGSSVELLPGSAWPALPAPCMTCGHVGLAMAVVVGGWACDGPQGRCADRLPKPPTPAGWHSNVPPDCPIVAIPAGPGCAHCERTGVPGIQWPAAGRWVCVPGDPDCDCEDWDCCSRWEQVGDELECTSRASEPGRLRVYRLGVILAIEGEEPRRRYLVDRGNSITRWYDEADLVNGKACEERERELL